MFTGLIQKIGVVTSVGSGGSGKIIRVDLGSLAEELCDGDSVCIDGVCLSAVSNSGAVVGFDVSAESLRASTIGGFKPGKRVNVELAMAVGERFGGHIVQGHIDGTAKAAAIKENQGFYELRIEAGENLMENIIKKGSVAVNGISLTAAEVDKNSFTVAVIPVTWRDTNLKFLKAGEAVNIETDIIVKAVGAKLERLLSRQPSEGKPLTIQRLKEMGF